MLIYHSHPREAYNPLLGAQSDNPSSAIAFQKCDAGRLIYCQKRLEEPAGLALSTAQDDYATKVPDYSWNFSYKYSRITVKAATR
jgi:stage II sporulation protein P